MHAINDIKPLCEFVKALGSESRMKIMMSFLDGRERTVNEIADEVGLGQSTCSEHLAILRRAGVLIADRRGKEVFYLPNRSTIVETLESLSHFLKRCC
ncbi:MAG: winged helix-turn-helix transcriptional regulator [Hahellaceae bacterium]|nr:winged helix-turn-helix transcriptional regulator [Hahellaceae bacterium]